MIRLRLALSTAVLWASCQAFAGVHLADLGGWDIVVDPNAVASERYAARQFRSLLAEATGRRLPVVSETARADRHVFVGPGKAMAASNVGFAVDQMGPEELRIVVRGRNVAIAGGRPRGTLYGVYQFLEDHVGVRFLTAEHTHVPRLDRKAVLGPLDRSYSPPLSWRCSYSGENRPAAFAVRMRCNAIRSKDPNLGGASPLGLINHTFSDMLQSRHHGKDHPEYFAEIDGKRRVDVAADWGSEGTQLCPTNPDVQRLVIEKVLAKLDGNPGRKNISVSQNDNLHYCRCARCRKLNEREGTPMAAQLQLVNRVADAVAAKHPGVLVGTLAYQYSRKPPRTMTCRENVQIELCSFEACVVHPLNDANCPQNVGFGRDLDRWRDICKHVHVWNYNANFRDFLLPFPNLRVIGPNLRWLASKGVEGMFMHGGVAGGELSDLRNYLICRLMWNPSLDADELIDEFLALHYGRAAGPLRRYIDWLHDRAQSSGLHPCCYGRAHGPIARYVSLSYDLARQAALKPVRSNAPDFGIDREVAEKALACFAEAARLAETDAQRRRVEKASLTALRAAIEPIWMRDDPSDVDAKRLRRVRPKVSEFFRLCRKHDVRHLAEHVALDDLLQKVWRLYDLGDDELP
jgi:hypothetical protein